MEKPRSLGLLILIIGSALPSCVNVIAHDQATAAKAATGFAQIAFVSRDYPKAHGLLASRSQKEISEDVFTKTVTNMHPKGFPSRITATEFEPMPGQRAMTIYLKGDGDGEDFYYRLQLDGDATSGYRVTGLFRGNGPYPPSARRPLNP
jgi:hypothetical protein